MSTNPTVWHPERNVLEISLSAIRNDDAKLELTSWNHQNGITWTLISNNEVEHHNDPFEQLHFPIWERDDDRNYQLFLDQIPSEILAVIKRFRSDGFGMLMLQSLHRSLTPFYRKFTTLFWLLFRRAIIEQWTVQQFLAICFEGEMAILKAVHFPENQIALDILGKITATHFSRQQYDLIDRLFSELDYETLNQRTIIPDSLIRFLLQHIELQHLKLWLQWDSDKYNELLKTLRGIKGFAEDLKIDTVSVNQLLHNAPDLPDLKTLEDCLRTKHIEETLQNYENLLKDVFDASTSFPKQPITDTVDIIAIQSVQDLLEESKTLQHDLVKYAERILQEQYCAYRILAPERATLLLYLFPTKTGSNKPVIKTLVTFNGKIADNVTMETVKAWLTSQSSKTGNT